MSLEYSLWAKTALWVGENNEKDFPDLRLSVAVYDALTASVQPPPYLGGTPKTFDSPLTRLFLGFDGKLLSPDNCRATARWLADWAGRAVAAPDDIRSATVGADWLIRAADGGWYVAWSV